ncbi:DUF2957 domain-containing protein [Burkholderia pseudomultivorans]|uniref:Lipoprotein n=1 Tax=Burkholderia pseudomultivorans TaxID=1207504 RepID=A0A132EQ20_9BURK|nr:DUF2957 domain-containing protein [Burkholderia pseudomultivorans]KWF55997.1 hypothetical protein WT57_05855 [Burkholderia pseudomultivorans]
MPCMTHIKPALLACTVLLAPFIAGCGGGADDPGPVTVSQCSGSACGPSGPSTTPAVVNKLCPDSLDYSTTYTGGSGSGEYVKVKFDTTKLTYQMQFIDSSVPNSSGQVNNTRAGLTISGTFVHPTKLPTAEQNRCAFVLTSGSAPDSRLPNGTYTPVFNPADPPMLFVGNGVVGGGIPGAKIQFDGLPGLGIGAVPERTFDFYPFIGFTDTETDFSKVAGVYNEMGIHLDPLGSIFQTGSLRGWQPNVVNWNETFDTDGSCKRTEGSDYSCRTTGTPWSLRKNDDGTADNVFVSNVVGGAYPIAGQGAPLVLVAPSTAHGVMIVGKLNGVLVPVIIRVGYAFISPSSDTTEMIMQSAADPEVGISVLSPAQAVAQNLLKGGYIGATSASACAIVTSEGVSGIASNTIPDFNASIPHPDLPGTFTNGAFIPAAGSCTDGSAVHTMAANYTSTLFQGNTAAFIDPTTSSGTAAFGLDYTQTSPGKIKVTAATDFNAKGANGNVAIFKKGDTGWIITAGNVYAMVVNNNQVNPFFTVGAFIQ